MLDLQRIADSIEFQVWNHPSKHKPTIVLWVAKMSRVELDGNKNDLSNLERKRTVSQIYNIMDHCGQLTRIRIKARASLENLGTTEERINQDA